ncbi:MAG: hypothetical protein BAA01_00890 [Bacillus thermozeamaize]|uniref:AB hydrolase-1 domain-containing protein n=1 Tax=Bacillus thermozeamaize TaxID=230954 RepID=A0A1Y3PAR4_9BACI|nr:MAG: hypothetical protein BAA01_00890 [Bacillus thermozeamaize]
MPTIQANGIEMYYEIHGQGTPLVMIMGLSANLDWWEPEMIERLSKRYRLLLFDNRGAGRTEKPAVEYSIPMFAQDTAALMSQVGIEKAHILGVSMGGMIAQEFALHYPERVDKLVLVCTNCGGAQSVPASPEVLGWLANRNVSPDELKQRQLKLLFPDSFVAEQPDKVERFWERVSRAPIPLEAFQRQLGAIQRFGTYDRLDRITSPTLVMTGSEDILVPPRNSEILAERIPGARLEIFPGGGHGFTGQFPEKFCQVVEQFLG